MNAVHCRMNCHWDGCNQAAAGEVALKEHVDYKHISIAGIRQPGSTTPSSEEICTPRTPEMSTNRLSLQGSDSKIAVDPPKVRSLPTPPSGNSGSKTCQWTSSKGICGQDFADGNELQTHVESQHLNDLKKTHQAPNNCKWLGCTTTTPFSERSKLARHLYTHTKYMVGRCQHCQKEFNNKNQLANHVRTHTAEKPFKCTECGWKASNEAALTTHMRTTHTGDRPLKCDKCGYTCGDPSNMSKHRKTHEAPLHKRILCEKAFCHMLTLKRHMRSHESDSKKRAVPGLTCTTTTM